MPGILLPLDQPATARGREMEAAGGIEPPVEVLQTSALPLGYAATAPLRRRMIVTKPLPVVNKRQPGARNLGAGGRVYHPAASKTPRSG